MNNKRFFRFDAPAWLLIGLAAVFQTAFALDIQRWQTAEDNTITLFISNKNENKFCNKKFI